MTIPRLAAALAGLVLSLFVGTAAEATTRHTAPAHVVTTASRQASVQLVARHRHYQRHRQYSHRSYRRHG